MHYSCVHTHLITYYLISYILYHHIVKQIQFEVRYWTSSGFAAKLPHAFLKDLGFPMSTFKAHSILCSEAPLKCFMLLTMTPSKN